MSGFHVFLLILYGIDCNIITIMFLINNQRLKYFKNELKKLKEKNNL